MHLRVLFQKWRKHPRGFSGVVSLEVGVGWPGALCGAVLRPFRTVSFRTGRFSRGLPTLTRSVRSIWILVSFSKPMISEGRSDRSFDPPFTDNGLSWIVIELRSGVVFIVVSVSLISESFNAAVSESGPSRNVTQSCSFLMRFVQTSNLSQRDFNPGRFWRSSQVRIDMAKARDFEVRTGFLESGQKTKRVQRLRGRREEDVMR